MSALVDLGETCRGGPSAETEETHCVLVSGRVKPGVRLFYR